MGTVSKDIFPLMCKYAGLVLGRLMGGQLCSETAELRPVSSYINILGLMIRAAEFLGLNCQETMRVSLI
jgi:hypothetical protein